MRILMVAGMDELRKELFNVLKIYALLWTLMVREGLKIWAFIACYGPTFFERSNQRGLMGIRGDTLSSAFFIVASRPLIVADIRVIRSENSNEFDLSSTYFTVGCCVGFPKYLFSDREVASLLT